MKLSKGISPLTRAIGVFSAVAIIAGGVTYAALQSTATLTDTSISTANADLRVYNFTTNQYASTAPGFTITDLIPGTGVDKNFYLQNNGTTPLTVTANVPTLPGAPAGGDFGFSGYQNVLVDITGEKCGDVVHTNLSLLNAGQVALPCNPLTAGAAGDSNATGHEGNYKVHFDINSAAVTGSSAGVGNFNIVFNGTATAPVPVTPSGGSGL